MIRFKNFFFLITQLLSIFSLNLQSAENSFFHKEPLYYITKAPTSIQEIWGQIPELFSDYDQVKPHDSSFFAKWHQLSKFWSEKKNEYGHYERKESIVISPKSTDNKILNKCYQELRECCVKFLSKVESENQLSDGSLSMKYVDNPSHVLRLLHYLPRSSAIAHYDTSIMTCLYYQEKGLQLKINGKWIDAPELKPNEMLVMYGVPGEILSNGHLKAIKHRVKCNNRYAIAYFHNTPKNYTLSSESYSTTTMKHVYQEAQLWYADVNARVVRQHCKSTTIPWYIVLYGYLAQWWAPKNDNHLSNNQNE